MSTSPHTCAHTCQPLHPPQKGLQPNPHSPAATTRPAFAIHPSAVMGPKFLAQSHTISRKLSSNAPASLRSVYTSKQWTKRQLLQAACSKNPTAIRPVPMHADRDPRRRRQSSPSHKLRKSQFKQMPTSPRTCAHTWQPLHPPQKGHQPNPHSPPATTRAAFAIHPPAVMRPKFLTQSHTISRKLSSNAPASLRSLYISKNRTKRQLLQAACSKNPTAIRPVPMHADRDPRRRRQSSPSHKLRKSQFKQMPTSPRPCAHTCQPLQPPQKGLQRGPCAAIYRVCPVSCAQNFLPNLTQSLVISRRTLVHLSCLSTLQPPQKCFQDESRLKPGLCRTIKQLNRGRLAFPSAIRNTKYAIQKSGFPI